MVVDTSAILAVLFDETNAKWVADRLNEHAGELRMSTVNLPEALILLRDRQPAQADELEDRLMTAGIRFLPPDAPQARIAARARLTFPLNLGDCFAYALAVTEKCPILTLDGGFRAVDCPVVMP